MSKKKNIPEIRFKGFDDEWEEFTLANLAYFNPKSPLPDVFEYVDLESVVGTEMISHRQETVYTAPSRAQRLACYGDLFFQTVRPYQQNNYLFNITDDNYVFSTGYAQMRPFGDGYFLLNLVQNDRFLKMVLDNCTGTSYPAINSKALAELDVTVPNVIIEQSRIGSYFQHLDKLINLHQKKYDKLAALKKAMLEKMFPKDGSDVPEIRFKGFDGKWEERILSDMAEYKNGKGHEDRQRTSGRYELINLNSISIDGGLKHSGKFIDETNATLQKNDLVMVLSDVGHGDLLGRVALIPENNRFVLNQRVALLRPNQSVDAIFLYYNINAHQFYFKAQGAGMSQLNISRSSVENFISYIPALPQEQQKIGSYFQNLDKLIYLHQKELDKLKNIKKACLEKMFV